MSSNSNHAEFLKDRVALVTGSSSGIGLGIARQLARAGCQLVVHGLVPAQEGQALAAQLAEEFGIRTRFIAANLSQPQAVEALVADSIETMGRLDILVNNAGIQYTARTEDFPLDRWQSVLDINLTAAFVAIKAALPAMQAQGFGRIINIASVHGLVASVEKAAYVAAKHGIVGLTKVVALENAERGITCNAICPGWVDTAIVAAQVEKRAQAQGLDLEAARVSLVRDKQPMPRMTAPDAIGQMIAFLCSSAADTITGTAMPIDGGWTAQ